MAGFLRAHQKLNDLEDRLRRWLSLAGDIGATFTPAMSPVVVAGDLREPGLHDFRGRYFSYHHEFQVIAAPNVDVAVQFAVDVVIDSVECESSAAMTAQGQVVYLPPGVSPGIAVTRPCGVWMENLMTTTDAPPMMDSGANYLNSTMVPSVLNVVHQWGLNAPQRGPIPLQLHMPAGSSLVFEGLTGGTIAFGLAGHVF